MKRFAAVGDAGKEDAGRKKIYDRGRSGCD